MCFEKEQELIDEITKLRETLKQKEELLYKIRQQKDKKSVYFNQLSSAEISRYSRQMIMPQIKLSGQIALKESKVLIVGAGGLGCPAALYLVAAGVGNVSIVDYDEVELSNLHRQILHSEADIGYSKVKSAYNTLKSINSHINIIPLQLHANSLTLQDLISKNKYDVVIDGSDNVATRYLLNDVCVINKIPLVSGSALQMEGQLTVYNYRNSPCYRCLFPIPPPPNTITNCGDGGVLGVVPGTIGILQALETIKILTKVNEGILAQRLLIFDASDTSFRNVRLRPRNKNCDVCGDNPTILSPIDYELFCGAKAHDKITNINILDANENIDSMKFSQVLNEGKRSNIVLDVRSELEYEMCKLPNTVNIPYNRFEKGQGFEELKELIKNKSADNLNIYVLCRRGNDSQRSVQCFKENFYNCPVTFINVEGGLHAYSKNVDPSFPIY